MKISVPLIAAIFLGQLLAIGAGTDGRIDMREKPDGQFEFFNAKTGARFCPYGFNYIVLGNKYPSAKAPSGYHNLFDTEGDNGWEANREKVRADLSDIAAKGYNTVRVFFNTYVTGKGGPDAPVNADAPAIDDAYFDNFIEFLKIAKENGLYVTFVLGHFPNPYLPLDPGNPITSAKSAPEALGKDANKMLPYIRPELIRAQQAYLRDALQYILKSGLRDVIFSIEPVQELGFRCRYPDGNKLSFVYPWNKKSFGPWPENPGETDIRPSVYDLTEGSDDQFRFYTDLSYYYPEQMVRAIRSVKGAEDLLMTISCAGGLLNEKFKTVGFNGRAWSFPIYSPSLGHLGEKDRHVYVDMHIYPADLAAPASERPGLVDAQIDRRLFSFGLLDSHDGPETKTKYWREEKMRAPLVLGETGARTPDHPKTPAGGDPGLATPEAGVAALKETVKHSAGLGFSGCLFWLHNNGHMASQDGAPSRFYTPANTPEFDKELAPKSWAGVPY